MFRIRSLTFLACLLLAVTGCATRDMGPSSAQNPPPKQKFSSYTKFDLRPVQIMPPYDENGANQKAATKIEEHLRAKLLPRFVSWNKGSRTLRIEPRIEKIKFIGGGARFMVGAMAGSSAVLMKVRYIDVATNTVIAEPEFYRVANAHQGGYSMGVSDNLMLNHIAAAVDEYTSRNYYDAVGGPTGI